jgi:PAS domain S-box-containing protein
MSKFLDPTREDDDRLLLSLKDRQLHTLFATTLDAIAIADDQGFYLDVNPAACELFGLTREELLGRSISEFAIPGFDFQAEWQEFQQQETVRGEFQLVRADGDLRVVEYVAAANFLPHRHLSILRDITKQHAALCERQQAESKIKELTVELDQLRPRPLSELEKAQAQLRESQQRLESILGSIEGVVWSVHPETFETIYINSAVEQIFGYSVADFLENLNLWQEVIHPEDQYLITAALPKLFENGKTKTKYRIIRSDRQVRWVLVNSSLVYDETGKPIRIDGITTDITEHQQSKQLLEKVTQHIPGAIYQFRERPDGTFHFPYASQNLELLCGVAPEELQKDAARVFLSIYPEDLDRVVESILESKKSLTPWYCEYRSYLPDGQIQWLLGHSTPQRELDGSTVWYGYIRDITDQKYIETALVESEAQNRAILQAIPDLMFRVNSQGIYLDYAKTTELLAFQGQAISSIGKNMADYLPPDVYQRQRLSIDIAMATRQTQVYEQEVTIGGRLQQEEVRVVPIEGLDEVLFIIRDISEQQAALQERKQAELENIKNQNFLSSIIENIPNMVFVKDAEDLKFIRFNKAGEELLGYSREALLGKNDYDFFPPEEADFFIKKDREVLASGKVLDIPEEQIQTNHQGIHTLHTRKIPILDESGNPQYLLGISEDITDLKKSEARLREVTQLQQAILDGANYTIISTDINGLIKTINAAAQRNLGYTVAEVVDQFTPIIFHDLEEVKQRAAELTLELGREISVGFEVFTVKAALGMVDEYEWTCIHKNGSRFPMQLSVTALRDEEGLITGFLGIGRDISEQKTVLSERKLAETALAYSEAQNRAILQAIPDLMFRVDRAGIYLSYSEPTELFSALCNQEAVGKPMIDYLPSEVYQSHKHHMELALETKQIQIYEQEVMINGRVQQEEVRVVPIEDKEEILFIIRDISNRKQAEAALAESEAQNRAILQAIPDLMFRVDRAGIYLSYSKSSQSTELLDSLGNQQALGKSMVDYLPPEIYQLQRHYMEMALETKQIQVYEQEVTINGKVQQEEVRVVPLEDREEVLFIVRDISDRRLAETQLKEISERLSMSLKSGGIGSWEWDIKQNILVWDDRMYELYGVDPETNQGLAYNVWITGLHPDDRATAETVSSQALSGEAEYDTEFRVIHPDGSIHFLRAFALVLRDSEGEPQKMIGINLDITDRKRQEQSLRLIVEGTAAKIGEEFFKSCVQYLAQALEVRYAFIAEFANTEKSLATTLAFWSGSDFGDNISYQLCGSPCENIQDTLCRYSHSVQLLFPENQDLINLQVESYAGLPILDAEGNSLGLLVVMDTKPMIQDIETQSSILKIFATRAGAEMERMQAEEAVRRSEIQLRLQSTELEATLKKLQNTQAQLIQSEKMSGLGQLVAGIAHEINNPVSFIHGNIKPAHDYASNLIELIRLYQTHYPSPPAIILDFIENIDLDYLTHDFSNLLESMKVGVARITDIVKSLRTFSRLDETGLKAIDLHENIDSTLAVLQNRLNGLGGTPEISLMRNYGDLPLIEAYGGLLNQVFMNLLVNAIDAIEQHQNNLEPAQRCNYKGMITITTSLSPLTNQAIISIRDNGSGMSPQVQEKIFNPFFTTKPVGKGTGMGLAISYQIMEEKHQGNISVNSTPEQGTEFMITLPIKQASVARMNEPSFSPRDVRSI